MHFAFFSAHSPPAFIGEEAGTDVLPFCGNIILLACLDLTVNARIKEKIFQGSQQNYPGVCAEHPDLRVGGLGQFSDVLPTSWVTVVV